MVITFFVDQQALALDVLSKEVEVRFHSLHLWQHSASDEQTFQEEIDPMAIASQEG